MSWDLIIFVSILWQLGGFFMIEPIIEACAESDAKPNYLQAGLLSVFMGPLGIIVWLLMGIWVVLGWIGGSR